MGLFPESVHSSVPPSIDMRVALQTKAGTACPSWVRLRTSGHHSRNAADGPNPDMIVRPGVDHGHHVNGQRAGA